MLFDPDGMPELNRTQDRIVIMPNLSSLVAPTPPVTTKLAL